MNTTEKKIADGPGEVSRYEATQKWTFYRCDECESAGHDASAIVHGVDCSERGDESE